MFENMGQNIDECSSEEEENSYGDPENNNDVQSSDRVAESMMETKVKVKSQMHSLADSELNNLPLEFDSV